VWGDDLAKATKDSFEELGGTVVDGIRYSPTTEDFATELGPLNSKVTQTIE
jgi:ABC-type branched-subunit amino acid transport system substrate-binding protein